MNFLLALAANTFFFLGFQALFPVLPLYVNSIGGTPAQNGLLTFVFAAAAVLSRPFIGQLTDRWGRKPMMLVGAIIFSISPLGYAASRSVLPLLLARAFQGVGIAAFTTAYQALIVDLSPPERRGQSLGLSANSMAIAMLLGPLAGDAVAARFGFTPLFILSAASATLCALLVGCIRPAPFEPAQAAILTNLRQVLAQRGLQTALLGMSIMGIVFGAFMTFIPLYAQQANSASSGLFFTLYALALLLVQAGAGQLSDRVGRALVAVPALALIGAFILLLSQAQAAWVGLSAAFLYGLGAGAGRVALDGMVVDSVPPTQRATAVAMQFTCYDLWIGLGGASMGPVAQATSYSAMYAITGILAIAGAIPFACLARKQSPPASTF